MGSGTAPPGMPSGSPARRTMRKGTRSCTECRRRKIRCDLSSGGVICFNCKSRRAKCVSQVGEIASAHGTNQPNNTAQRDEAAVASSDLLANSITDQRAPFIAVLDRSGLTLPDPDQGLNDTPNGKRICETLRAALPSYDAIIKVASEHTAWWQRINRSMTGTKTLAESFPDYVKTTYTSDEPAAVGKMTIAYAFACNTDAFHLYTLVNRLVLSDTTYVSTDEGMECLILLAILYADEGQPRRSWMVWRRGIVVSQLTDLYRSALQSPIKRRLWLSLYRGDRLMSMLLGLPYGSNDVHHRDILAVASGDHYFEAPIQIRCAQISGKLIDLNHSRSKASLSKTLELDEEMNELAATMPGTWWAVDQPHLDLNDLKERMHLQLFFFHLRIYIYLPFLSRTASVVHDSMARLACMEAARQLLQRYLALHRQAGPWLSECKLVDFMGFTAAVVLLLGWSSAADSRTSSTASADLELIMALMQTLQTLESQEGCGISAQCRRTLAELLLKSEEQEVRIPFFGTVRRAASESAQDVMPVTGHERLPSEADTQEPWDMPELDFLAEWDGSTSFDPGWDYFMDSSQ